ncbi:MAG: DsrE/DsrF/DrsH-like family protein [Deltaproteobacteria bacterium]|nr:DsrE/DsrF/DrsH-like family protein [Deltaproteobacteria bacterium]
MNKASIIVLSGDMDKVIAAFNIAIGAASSGMDVTMLFTFWGLNVLRKDKIGANAKGIMQKMLTWMNKGGTENLPMSRFNMFGLGTWMMKKLMKRYKMPSVKELYTISKQLGVKVIACTITMGMMGIAKEDLVDDVDEFAGVITYIKEAQESKINLFI